jgi:hypothetical protein
MSRKKKVIKATENNHSARTLDRRRPGNLIAPPPQDYGLQETPEFEEFGSLGA